MVDTATSPAPAPIGLTRSPLLSRWRPFVDVSVDARHRRPADLFALLVGVVLLAMVTVRAADPQPWETTVADWFLEAPSWLDTALDAVLHLGSVWAVVVLAGSALLARRWRLARDLLVAGLGTWLVALALGELVEGERSAEIEDLIAAGGSAQYPVVRVAVITALVVTATPYVVRPLRHVGAGVVVISALAALVTAAGLPIDILAAVILGMTMAAAVHVALGSPEGRPGVGQVVAGAAELDIEVLDGALATDQHWGEVIVTGRDAQGNPLRVKALGRDAADLRLVNRTWHHIWYRGGVESGARHGLPRVKDEALVTVLAERAGASVPSVLAVGGDRELAVLVERTLAGRRLSDLADEELQPDLLERVWTSVARLHRAGLSHGSLSDGNVIVAEDGAIELQDLGLGQAPAPPAAASTDVAELLASLAVRIGPQRAIEPARRALGDDALATSLPYLQLPALSPGLRDAIRARDKADKAARGAVQAADPAPPAPAVVTPAPTPPKKGTTSTGDLTLGAPKPSVLGDLRREILAATGAEEPEPVKLQRITVRGVAMVALTLFGVYLLMSQFTNVAAALDELAGADLWWVAVTIAIGQLPEFPNAVATLGSVNRPIPYGPTVVLEYAEKFTGLVVPSTVGTAAMHARFLNQLGIPVASAVTAGVLVSVGGLVVQVLIFIPCLLLTGPQLSLSNISASSIGWAIVIGAVGIGLLVTIVYVVPKLRAMIVPRVKQAVSDVTDVLRSPAKAIRILFGNFTAQLLYAICLGTALAAFDTSISLPALLVVNTASSLFAGLMPVPGGIGVAEASLAAGLIAYGVPPSIAGAAALLQRIATFYLPPIWGWVAFRWLSKRDYI